LKRDRFPYWKAADMAGMVIPIGLTFGRMGCLLGGCCFGSPWQHPLALVFPPYSAASAAQARDGLLQAEHLHSLSVHPTQLYAALRFILEYFRADDRGGIAMFSTSQWLGLVLIALALTAHRFLRRRAQARAD